MSPKRSKPAPEPAKVRYEEDFKEWSEHPTTKKLMKWLAGKIQGHKDDWASGKLLATFAHEQFVKEAVAKGYINACDDVLDLNAEDLEDNE